LLHLLYFWAVLRATMFVSRVARHENRLAPRFVTIRYDAKVTSDGHTLILGWSECTVRCVVQLSFLRRQSGWLRLVPRLRGMHRSAMGNKMHVFKRLCTDLT